jgi:hypothetical protein
MRQTCPFIILLEVKNETESSYKILVTTFQIQLHNNAEHKDRPINPRLYIRGRVFSREVEIFPNIMEC